MKYNFGYSSDDINVFVEQILERYNALHSNVSLASKNLLASMAYTRQIQTYSSSYLSSLQEAMLILPRPDVMVITPFITNNAPTLGGPTYNISSDTANINNIYGSIAKQVAYEEERISESISVVNALDNTINTLSPDNALLLGQPWIVESVGDIRFTMILKTLTTQYLNNIRIVPIHGTHIKKFEYTFSVNNPGGWTTLFEDDTWRIYDLYLTNLRATSVRITLTGDDVKGFDNLSLKHIGLANTDNFTISFSDTPTIRNVEYFQQTITNGLVVEAEVQASSEVIDDNLKISIPENITHLSKVLIYR